MALLGLFLSSCGPRPTDTLPRLVGGLQIECDPADALIYVDDKYLGSVKGLKQRPLKLTEGTHRIELRREGYFAHYAEVTVVKGVQQRLQVKLRKEPF